MHLIVTFLELGQKHFSHLSSCLCLLLSSVCRKLWWNKWTFDELSCTVGNSLDHMVWPCVFSSVKKARGGKCGYCLSTFIDSNTCLSFCMCWFSSPLISSIRCIVFQGLICFFLFNHPPIKKDDIVHSFLFVHSLLAYINKFILFFKYK